jgi:hypothetical protein
MKLKLKFGRMYRVEEGREEKREWNWKRVEKIFTTAQSMKAVFSLVFQFIYYYSTHKLLFFFKLFNDQLIIYSNNLFLL